MTADSEEETLEETLSTWQQREVEREERRREEFDRAMAVQERQVAAAECLAEAQHHVVAGDSAADRLSAFFGLPQDQQDFRLREEAVSIAAKVGGNIDTVLRNADAIARYIRGSGLVE